MKTRTLMAERKGNNAMPLGRSIREIACKRIALLAIGACAMLTNAWGQLLNPPGDPVAPEEPAVMAKMSQNNVSLLAITPALLADSLALVQLYDAAGGSGWTRKANWKTGKVNTWQGVTVSGGRVTRVQMTNNNLVGSIPAAVGNLSALTILDLSRNQLSGTLPASIGNLTALTILYLEYNQLTGPIPASYGNLVNMVRFYLHRNQLSGDIPPSLANLTRMQYIGLHANNLTGNLDWIANMRSMVQLYYYGNPNLDCVIPESVGNLVNMTEFVGGGWVGNGQYVHTKVHGPIPASLGNCTKLTSLYLDNSDHTGTVPATINNLKNLKVLALFYNWNLEGDLTTMIAGFNKLQTLTVSYSRISGSLPASVITTNLRTVDITRSAVSPNFPPTFTSAVNVDWISLDSVGMTQMPDWSGYFPKLIWLTIRNNKLDTLGAYQTHPNKANLQLLVDNNRLDFADLEVLFDAGGHHPFARLDYIPQEKSSLPAMTYVLAHNSNLRIDAPPGGLYGTYTWEKQEGNAWLNVQSINESATPNAFVIGHVLPSHRGTYRYTVANARVPGLTFTRTINVSVTGQGGTIQFFSVRKIAGAICGQDTVVLWGSQAGVAYQLRRDSVDVGEAVMGTSQPVRWTGLTASGTYSILASDTATGSAAVLPDRVTISCGYDSLVVVNSVGIGDTVPDGYSLAVAGKAIATGLNLKITRLWPDYVFQPDYELMPLGDVAAFIKKYGHLPGIPSAARVAAEVNYNVSAMDLTLLEKVEELTLYILGLKDALSGVKSSTSPVSFTRVPVIESFTLPPFEKIAYTQPVSAPGMQAALITGMSIHQSLAIGLSRPMPEGYRLAVGGNIIATGLDLKAPANWPDYVFADNYNLLSLKALRQFIKRNRHLPGMPSARDMSANGVYSLAEMDARLLEKIEELTLYIIHLGGVVQKGQEAFLLEEGETKVLTSPYTLAATRTGDTGNERFVSAAVAVPVEFEEVLVRNTLSVASPRPVPANYKLAVGGSIIAAGMDLKAPQKWPDYVFNSGYELMSLDDLANYIRQHGHLPNLPSAADMNKRGDYNTADMDARILEKIEELTLYILALDGGRQSE